MSSKRELREEIKKLREYNSEQAVNLNRLWVKQSRLQNELKQIKAKVAELVALTHDQQKIAILS